jgi:hypothetical protein
MIYGSQELTIATRGLLVFHLRMGCFDMTLVVPSLFVPSGAPVDSAAATVVADAIHGYMLNCAVVDVDVGDSDVVDAPVVIEIAAVPIPTAVPYAEVSEAVINATVEPDVGSPIARVPDVCVSTPTPIAGRPEQTGFRGLHPCARYPIVALIAVCPVSRRPNVSVARAWRLHINRQDRRRYPDRDHNAGK